MRPRRQAERHEAATLVCAGSNPAVVSLMVDVAQQAERRTVNPERSEFESHRSHSTLGSSNGRASALQADDEGSTPSPSTVTEAEVVDAAGCGPVN